MTPEQQALLTARRWLAKANAIRITVAKSVAKALETSESRIVFSDHEETSVIARRFADQTDQVAAIEVPNRASAIQIAQTELINVRGPAYLLPRGYDECGAIALDFESAVTHLDALLSSQQEILRLILKSGAAGICIFSQEGPDESFARYVQLWPVKPLLVPSV